MDCNLLVEVSQHIMYVGIAFAIAWALRGLFENI